MNEEQWLQEMCKIMLRDFLSEALEAGLSLQSSLSEANDFIERFMVSHNLK